MNWLIIATIAHFFTALVFIIDKFLLSKTTLKPITYSFYAGILGIFVIWMIPFGFAWIPLFQIGVSLLAGAFFILAILFFYKSIKMGEVSRITPIIGGAIPIFTLIMTYFILGERLSLNKSIAFSFLVLGGIVMVLPRKAKPRIFVKTPLVKRLPIALFSALFFAGSYVLTKYIFTLQPFINGFIWTRFGGILGAGLIFFWPGNRQRILKASKKIRIKTISFFVSNRVLSALAFILLNYAIYLGSVTLVNALQGVQYVFLLMIAFFLSKKYPQIIKEQVSNGILIKKVIAILFIALGLGILVF